MDRCVAAAAPARAGRAAPPRFSGMTTEIQALRITMLVWKID
jgi:hypothetical protein